MKKLFFLFVLNFFSQFTLAGYVGTVDFSYSEVLEHAQKAKSMAFYSRSCLENHSKTHKSFYQNNCITLRNGKRKCLSKFYGERRYSKVRGQRRSDGELLEYLPDVLKREGFNPNLVNQMEATSCVGLALRCLGEGFHKTGQSIQWNKIMKYVRANGVSGTALQDALQKIGWRTYYWNPMAHGDIPQFAKIWDNEEANWKSKGYHFYRYQKVIRNGTYWFNKVDDSDELVGFGKVSPSFLDYFPYWVGTAHTGYHVFPGSYSQVIEAHSTRHITSYDNLEISTFSPLASGGGPRWTPTEKYRSGLIALPPIF